VYVMIVRLLVGGGGYGHGARLSCVRIISIDPFISLLTRPATNVLSICSGESRGFQSWEFAGSVRGDGSSF